MTEVHRPGETAGTERAHAMPGGGQRCLVLRAGPSGQPQHLGAHVGERAAQRARAARCWMAGRQAEQRPGGDAVKQGRGQFPPPPGGAHPALIDMPPHPPAQPGGQPTVPVTEQAVEHRAVAAPRPAHEQDRDRGLKLLACPGEQRVRVVAGHAEHGRHLRDLKAVRELGDGVALAVVQPADGRADQGDGLGALGACADVRAVVGQLGGVLQRRRRAAGPEPAQALVTRHGEQPGAESARITQPGELRRGDDERVLHRVRGIIRLAQQRPAVAEQVGRVLVVGGGESFGVAVHDRCDKFAITHSLNVAVSPRSGPVLIDNL